MKFKFLPTLLSLFLIVVVVIVILRYLRARKINILTEFTGRSLSTRTKLDEAGLPEGWKNGPDHIML